MPGDETIFLTGFPGFIASQLLRRLAASDRRFLLLVQPSFAAQAEKELQRVVQQAGRSAADFVVLPGDITEPNLGLSVGYLERARTETMIIFHLAAIYDLAVARELAFQVNVEGTRNMNAFARSVSRLRQYHYVSTCYVAGKRTGRILENELQHQAGFRNFYEETKYVAELEVENLKTELPVTIHRPAVVCGDSHSGETAKYDGIYYLIRYLLKWPAVLSTFNIGNNDVALNLVPVDFVTASMAALARDASSIGKTLQLADPEPLTTRQLFNSIARAISGRESRVTIPASLVHTSLMLPLAPRITALPHSAVPYFFIRQTYDTSQATALLEPHGIGCPPFDSYVQTIVDYVRNHPTL